MERFGKRPIPNLPGNIRFHEPGAQMPQALHSKRYIKGNGLIESNVKATVGKNDTSSLERLRETGHSKALDKSLSKMEVSIANPRHPNLSGQPPSNMAKTLGISAPDDQQRY